MRRLLLDTTHCSTMEDLQAALKRDFPFDGFQGRSLDALWDHLTDLELPVMIEWRGYRETNANIGEYVDRLERLFQDFEKRGPGIVFILHL
jgi:RNAse (barnase) inhibitor barstar